MNNVTRPANERSAADLLQQQIDAKDQRIEQLKQALDTYGVHLNSCDKFVIDHSMSAYQDTRYAFNPSRLCTCGLDAARKGTK